MNNIIEQLITVLNEFWYFLFIILFLSIILITKNLKKDNNKEKMNNKEKIVNKYEYVRKLEEKEKKYKKKYEEKIDKKQRQREFYQRNKKNGENLEVRTGKKYEERGYVVTYNGLRNGLKDEGIDLLCVSEKEIILIQCKNYTNTKSIDHKMVKKFHSNAIKYIKLNYLDEDKTVLKYVVPNRKVFCGSAIRVFKDEYYNCKYEVI